MSTVSNSGTPNVPATVMTYGYDNVGNDLSIAETINGTAGVTTTHQFDALNRMTVNTQGPQRVDYTYNAINQVTNKKRYSNAAGTNLVAETNHTYDNANRLTNIAHIKGATTISSYAQTYDLDSKITGITNNDGTSTYTYDDTDQLVGADYNYQTDENYTYDDNGNRTNTGYVTGVNNRLLEDSKYRYEYDLVGNRTKRTNKLTNEVTDYTWDIRDRLTGFTTKNASGVVIKSAQYIYDVYDQRIAAIVDPDGAGSQVAVTERFVYGSDQNIALVFDGNETLTHRYLFGNGIDQIEADEQIATDTTLWALSDHLGSVRDVVDESGTIQNHIVYDAFGNITSESNSSVIFRHGYTARELDAESGQYYYRSRYYDSFTGRFISEDKIGFAGGDANLYRYVGNNVVNAIDPYGRAKCPPSSSRSVRNSGLQPLQPRQNENDEKQRLDALNIVSNNRGQIIQAAQKYHITPSAIAGAILWEALENPYNSWFPKTIPGKIKPDQGEIAETVERENRVPFHPQNSNDRANILNNPSTAITYIAAIMDRAASKYERSPLSCARQAGIDIRNQAGILGSFFQGVDPDRGFQALTDRINNGKTPRPLLDPCDNAMGSWISSNRKWIDNTYFPKVEWRSKKKSCDPEPKCSK